jgi:exopolysaccharide biosynthesis WecB/TagA/CpsF family protein
MTYKVNVFDVLIDNVSLVQAVKMIIDASSGQQTRQFAFVNAGCLNIAYSNEEYRLLLNRVAGVFGDGSGVKYACKATGQNILDNVNGTDMFPLLCEQAALSGKSIFLLGGNPGVAQEAAKRSLARYPSLQVAGFEDGFFTAQDTLDVIQRINESGADILLVAMGAPNQETWIDQHIDQLEVGAAIGVGGLLDFLARQVSRAPGLVRRLGFEWVVRWLNEPGRLFKRYLVGNPLFIWRVLTQVRSVAIAPANPPVPPTGDDFRLAGSKFDLWNSFDVLEQVEKKYQKPDSTPSIRRKVSYWRQAHSYQVVKRGVDFTLATLVLVAFSPLFLLTGLLVFLDDPGPVFFKQKRIGLFGKAFHIYKFRSMYLDAESRRAQLSTLNESAGGVLFKLRDDPRVTRVGRFIRKYSIDELPQLVNVLMGDMSLVGPRPPLPAEVDLYSIEDRARLEIMPGITCIWQVSGRSDIDFVGQVALDLEYIRTRNLRQDILLLIRTIPAVLLGKGAY